MKNFDTEVSTQPAPEGDITRARQAMGDKTWNILGHTYLLKAKSASSFVWRSHDPQGTGVSPHVHVNQDKHMYVLEGTYTLYLDGQWTTAGPGDFVRMPMNHTHAYFNRSDISNKALFWVSPAGRIAELFDELDNLDDYEEVVRLSALHGVTFLPAGAIPGV